MSRKKTRKPVAPDAGNVFVFDYGEPEMREGRLHISSSSLQKLRDEVRGVKKHLHKRVIVLSPKVGPGFEGADSLLSLLGTSERMLISSLSLRSSGGSKITDPIRAVIEQFQGKEVSIIIIANIEAVEFIKNHLHRHVIKEEAFPDESDLDLLSNGDEDWTDGVFDEVG